LRGSWFKTRKKKKFLRSPSQPMDGHGGKHLSSQTTWEAEIGMISVQVCPGINWYSISKITNPKKTGRVAQVVECLPSKPETLDSKNSCLQSVRLSFHLFKYFAFFSKKNIHFLVICYFCTRDWRRISFSSSLKRIEEGWEHGSSGREPA
jgi:hypothetical protein